MATLALFEELVAKSNKKPRVQETTELEPLPSTTSSAAQFGGESMDKRIGRVFKKIDTSGFGYE
jgi:hypothetical protein